MQTNTKAALDILKTAKDLLTTKGHTKGTLARSANGERVFIDDPGATRYCALGAVLAAASTKTSDYEAFDNLQESACAYLENVVDLRNFRNAIHVWNDAPERTAGEVIHAFSLAIQMAEKDLAEEQKTAEGISRVVRDLTVGAL